MKHGVTEKIVQRIIALVLIMMVTVVTRAQDDAPQIDDFLPVNIVDRAIKLDVDDQMAQYSDFVISIPENWVKLFDGEFDLRYSPVDLYGQFDLKDTITLDYFIELFPRDNDICEAFRRMTRQSRDALPRFGECSYANVAAFAVETLETEHRTWLIFELVEEPITLGSGEVTVEQTSLAISIDRAALVAVQLRSVEANHETWRQEVFLPVLEAFPVDQIDIDTGGTYPLGARVFNPDQTNNIDLYMEPGFDAFVKGRLEPQGTGIIIDGPVNVDGSIWWHIRKNDVIVSGFLGGWLPESVDGRNTVTSVDPIHDVAIGPQNQSSSTQSEGTATQTYEREIIGQPTSLPAVEPFLELEQRHQEVYVSPNQRFAAQLIPHNDIRVYSLETGLEFAAITTQVLGASYPQIVWSPDSSRFLSTNGDVVAVWTSNGDTLFTVTSPGRILELIWSPDSNRIYARVFRLTDPPQSLAEPDGDVIVWDAATGSQLYAFGNVRDASYMGIDQSGTVLAVRGDRDRWEVWNIADEPENTLSFVASDYFDDDTLIFGTDPRYIYLDASIWDLSTGEPVVPGLPEFFEGTRVLIGTEKILIGGYNTIETFDIGSRSRTTNASFDDSWETIYSHDLAEALTVHRDSIQVTNLQTGQVRLSIATTERPHSVIWDSEQELLTTLWQDQDVSRIWRYDLSAAAIAAGEYAIQPNPSAVGDGNTSVQATAEDTSASTGDGGTCQISAPQAVNMRGGPGTNFERQGQLQPNTSFEADGQAQGDDGFVWWRLTSGAWVRSDVVEADADCPQLPDVQSP